MISRILVCLLATALGLYVAWWASSFAHFFYVDEAGSFEELTTTMFIWFVITAAIFCPLLCWSFLKLIKRTGRKNGTG